MLLHHADSGAKTAVNLSLAVAIVIAVPSFAAANVGTPLMWATMFHMFVGNTFIGIFEGTLLSRVYRLPVTRAIVVMILANYFSAWVGWMSLASLLEDRYDVNLYNARRILWCAVAAAYFATLVLEWPFIVFCFRGTGQSPLRSFRASLLVQSVSYVLLFSWYGLASVDSLLTDLTIVTSDQIPLPSNVRVYYIADEDGDVYSRDPVTGKNEKVFQLHSTDSADCLSFERSSVHEGCQEIMGWLIKNGSDPKKIHIAAQAKDVNCPLKEGGNSTIGYLWTSPSSGQASRLGLANTSPWTFHAGFWPAQGLTGENSKTGARFHFALETPFVSWDVRHAIQLPTDVVLFQLGKKQICILDPISKKIAVLCFGRGPIAVIDEPSDSQSIVE